MKTTEHPHPCHPEHFTSPHPVTACRQLSNLLRQPRPPGSDYYPSDAPLLDAWASLHEAPAQQHNHELVEHFVSTHLESLHDLILRAHCGRAPSRFLNELSLALDQILLRYA